MKLCSTTNLWENGLDFCRKWLWKLSAVEQRCCWLNSFGVGASLGSTMPICILAETFRPSALLSVLCSRLLLANPALQARVLQSWRPNKGSSQDQLTYGYYIAEYWDYLDLTTRCHMSYDWNLIPTARKPRVDPCETLWDWPGHV